MQTAARSARGSQGKAGPAFSRMLAVCLAVLLGFTYFGGCSHLSAQNVFDLDEINGDLRILGDEMSDYVGDRDSVAVFDFNNNGLNDLLIVRGQAGSVYGFFDLDFERPNTFIDTRTAKADLYMPPNWSAHFAFDRILSLDINGDDIDDLVTSSIWSYSAGDSSKIFVLFGSSAWMPPVTVDFTTDTADLTIVYGDSEDVFFGDSMASGDFNGDGIDDLLIGAENGENPEGLYKGAVYVVYGSTKFPAQHTIDFSQTPADITCYGGGGNDDFGGDVASGDVNGDGIDDVIVGAIKGELDNLGRVYIFYGSNSFPPNHSVDLTYESADISIIGPSYFSRFGRSVASGDINGDGIDDICGGSDWIYSPEEVLTGAAYLFYGRNDFPPATIIDLAQQPADITCYGEMENSTFGYEMKAGDLDGDGLDDWGISSYTSNSTPDSQGTTYILQGSDSYPDNIVIDFASQQPMAAVYGDDPNDYMRLCGEMTDVDQDGKADLILGAVAATRETYNNCGEAYIILSRGPVNDPPRFVAGPGPELGNDVEVRLYDPRSVSTWWSRFDPYTLSSYGTMVAAGDLDGDGYDEVITGLGPGPNHKPLVGGFTPQGERLFEFPAYGTPKYGVNVAAGDIDGDGIDEIITGAGPGDVYGPHVRGWRWNGGSSVTPIPGVSFLAYGTNRWGVNVAAGDIDGDGRDEILTGGGPGDIFGPHVRGWEYYGVTGTRPIQGVSFLAYGTNRKGVNVAAGDIDGDGIDEIVTGPGPGEIFGSHVRGWNYDGEQLSAMAGVSFIAYANLASQYGAVVACGDVDNDRVDEILTAPGPHPDNPPWLKTWSYDGSELTLVESRSFMVFEEDQFASGAKLACGNFLEPAEYLP